MCLNTSDSKRLCQVLHQNGFEVTSTSDSSFALRLMEEGCFSLLILDSAIEPISSFIEAIKKNPRLNACLLSQQEFSDFCPYEKGFIGHFQTKQLEKLIFFLKSFFKQSFHKRELQPLNDESDEFVFKSQIMKDIIEKARRIAKTQSSVLLTGESGTGKEVIAKFIHDQSLRSQEAFVAINSCAISPHLLESELFGYEKGAFTGATNRKLGRLEFANHGTFFFDEIGETPLELQAKLLRVIQERTFERVGGLESIKLNVRFIAATNRNLEEAIEKKQFREDLFYRLNVVPLQIPPLRERKDDIIPLAHHFLKKCAEKNQIIQQSLSDEAKDWLLNHSWPGNVRELGNAIERASVLSLGQFIERSDFLIDSKQNKSPIIDELNLESLEKKAILKALAQTGGNKTQAAKLLGVSIKTLRSKTQIEA
jgi:DNA-binding NtrC family response regulator